MLNHRIPTISVILRVCVPLALMLGAAAVARSADDSISAKLKKDTDVGVAFNDIPQGFFDVIVSLVHPDDWSIVTNAESSKVVSKSGDTIWNRTSADEDTHVWEGCGVTGNCWPGVLFAGNLTKHTSGGGGGTPPGFNASVADIDIDVDSLGLHSDEPTSHHWPPDGSLGEDEEEGGDGTGGLCLPASLVTGQFPTNLPSGTDYKTLKLTLNPKWVGTPSYDGNVGTLTFSTTGSGFALYELTGSDSGTLVTTGIRVPPNGFSGKQYGILTNGDFTSSGGITATFTWDSNLKGGEDTATDYVRIAPTAYVVVLHVDSDNTTAADEYPRYELGDLGRDEDAVKDVSPGKYIPINDAYYAGEAVPGFADGIDKFGNGHAGACGPFHRILLELKNFTDLSQCKIKFTYSGSDPDNLEQFSGDEEGAYDYVPDTGAIRIWKKDGSECRSPASASEGGDYIQPDVQYTAADLGLTLGQTKTLYMEAVDINSSDTTIEIIVEVDLDGSGTDIRTDRVKVTPILCSAENIGNGN